MTTREIKKNLNKSKLDKIVSLIRRVMIKTLNDYNNTKLQFKIEDKEPQYKGDYLRYDFQLATFQSSFNEKDNERTYLDVLGKNETSADDFELNVIDTSTRDLKKFAIANGVKFFMINTTTSMNGHWYVNYVAQVRIPYKLIIDNYTNESLKLNEMVGREIIKEKRILDLIQECIDNIRNIGYIYDEDMYFMWGDSLNTFGTMKFPDYDGGWYTLTLNKHMIDEDDEAIKNTIYHELAHYLDCKDLLDRGIYTFDWDGRLVTTSKYKRSIHGGHKQSWQKIADDISSKCHTKISRTDTYETHTGVGDYYKTRLKWTVTCTNCGMSWSYPTRRSDFCKDPNMTQWDRLVNKYGLSMARNIIHNDSKREDELKHDHTFYCTKCKHEGCFEVKENK